MRTACRTGLYHCSRRATKPTSRKVSWQMLLVVISAADLTMPGVVSVLAQLLEQSSSTKYAYLCHPRVQHISKLKREGTSRTRPHLKVPH